MMMIDVLRPKLVIARLGGRILNLVGDGLNKGNVQLPTKSAASTISWVTEGNAPASESNATIQGFTMKPYTATAYSDVTRRMLMLGDEGFEQQVINDLMTGISVAADSTALNGSSGSQPMGLFQFGGIPQVSAHGDTGNGGTITYSNLVAMNQIVGLYNGDAPATARLGWVTSPQGKATLSLTDKSASASTARYCWESHLQIVDGVERTVEHVLGYPAVATTLAPSAATEGSSSSITALAHGNFDCCWINFFTGFDVLVNPFLQSTTGVVRISVFQDLDVRYVRPESFVLCTNINAIVPQTSVTPVPVQEFPRWQISFCARPLSSKMTGVLACVLAAGCWSAPSGMSPAPWSRYPISVLARRCGAALPSSVAHSLAWSIGSSVSLIPRPARDRLMANTTV